MGFLDRLFQAASSETKATSPDAPPMTTPADDDGANYDRTTWRKKLKSVLDRLPDSASEWDDFMAEARALNFERVWVVDCLKAEFEMLVRKVVSDRVVSPQEHQKLETARLLMNMPEAEAIAVIDRTVAEAEAFFGKPVDKQDGEV